MSVRMDWFEGFHVYGERGSVLARSFQPWYMRTSEVECFSESDGLYRRPLGADGNFWRRQIEGFADTVLGGAVQRGGDARDGLAAVQALVAVQRSLATGEEIELAGIAGSV